MFGPMHHCLKGAADQRRKRRKQSSSDRSTKVREYSGTSHYRRCRARQRRRKEKRKREEAEEKVGGRGGRGEACLDSKIGSLKSVEAEAKARQRRGKAKRKREDAEEAD